jgi:hypothetical protein
LIFDPGFFFSVKVESDFAPMEVLPATGKPEIIDAPRSIFFKDDVFLLVVDIELRVSSPETIIIAACPVVAGKIIRFDIGINVWQCGQIVIRFQSYRLRANDGAKDSQAYDIDKDSFTHVSPAIFHLTLSILAAWPSLVAGIPQIPRNATILAKHLTFSGAVSCITESRYNINPLVKKSLNLQ